jgi:hypothetical protein
MAVVLPWTYVICALRPCCLKKPFASAIQVGRVVVLIATKAILSVCALAGAEATVLAAGLEAAVAAALDAGAVCADPQPASAIANSREMLRQDGPNMISSWSF